MWLILQRLAQEPLQCLPVYKWFASVLSKRYIESNTIPLIFENMKCDLNKDILHSYICDCLCEILFVQSYRLEIFR